MLIVASLLAILLFSSLGLIVGIYAQTWDHNAFVQNLVIQPLAFVGGVFYSVEILPSPWQELTHANPLFYIVDGIRYGFLGSATWRRRSRSPSLPRSPRRSSGGRCGCSARATS